MMLLRWTSKIEAKERGAVGSVDVLLCRPRAKSSRLSHGPFALLDFAGSSTSAAPPSPLAPHDHGYLPEHHLKMCDLSDATSGMAEKLCFQQQNG